MENYITKLEYLINLKKKEPAKLERDDFEHTWKQLVQETGFTPEAEKYLYSGLRFCSAKPFKDYMKTRDMMGALRELYSGKLFGDNCASTIQILYHLLALSINEFPDRLDVIGSLIQHIPSALLNKEGKIYGQAGRVIKKYFLDEIKSDAEIPTFVTLIDNGLNAGIAVDFANKLKTIIDGMDSDKFSKRCKDNMAKIFLWINPPKDTRSHESENILEHKEVSDEESDTKLVIQESSPENDQSEVNEIDVSEIPTEDQTIVKLICNDRCQEVNQVTTNFLLNFLKPSCKGFGVSVPGFGHSDIRGLVTYRSMVRREPHRLSAWITDNCANIV